MACSVGLPIHTRRANRHFRDSDLESVSTRSVSCSLSLSPSEPNKGRGSKNNFKFSAQNQKWKIEKIPFQNFEGNTMTKDLRESPKTIQRKHQKQDFGLYIQEVMRTANRRGASLPCYMEESLENSMSSAKHCLCVTQMKKDFNAVRCGDKKPEDVSSSNYCKGILVDSELAKYNTGSNADALAEAVSELLEEEVRFVLLTEDCCSFIFWRRRYTVLPPQGEVIRLLIDDAAQGYPDVPEKKIRKILKKKMMIVKKMIRI